MTEKAKQALCIALELSDGYLDCDEAFVAAGLRSSNTLLALLTDRYKLDFSTTDEENLAHRTACEDDVVREQLRKQRYPEQPLVDNMWDWFTEGPSEIVLDSGDMIDDETFLGSEGEPDETTIEQFRATHFPEVVIHAMKRCRKDGRSTV